MKSLLLLILGPLFFLNATAQCKVRFINKTDSIINVQFSGLGINVTLKGKDTSVYYSVQSMIGREPYIISFEGDQFQSEAGKDKTPITFGNWEIIFRWSTISNSWRSLMSQVVE